MKTSKSDFRIFKKSVEKWIDEFGLKDWDILIVHELINKVSGDIAWASPSRDGSQVATIGLCTEYTGLKVDKEGISKAGFHEVCHILLYNLCNLGESRFGVSQENYEKEVHSLITVLENTLWRSSKS